MRNLIFGTAVAAALFSTAAPVSAHHSGAMYDGSKHLQVTGTVQEFRWSNPHIGISLLATDGAGPPVLWRIEGSSPSAMARIGWSRLALRAGDVVTVTLKPHRSGEPAGLLESAVLVQRRGR